MSSLKKGIIQCLKTAHGHSFKKLHIVELGKVTYLKLVQGYETGEDYEKSHYLIHCTNKFIVKTNVHSTMLRGQANSFDSMANYVLLQISTGYGEIFYIFVHHNRIPAIREKALHYRSLK